jgi:hypothetical protein
MVKTKILVHEFRSMSIKTHPGFLNKITAAFVFIAKLTRKKCHNSDVYYVE